MSDENENENAGEDKVTVGSVAMQAIREGMTNEEALEAVKAAIPDAKTSLASINWYRNKMRSDGEEVPTARELKKQRKEAEAANETDDDGEPDALDS